MGDTSSGRISIGTSLRGMSDISRTPTAFQQLTSLVIPYLRKQYIGWSSLEAALESIEYSPTAQEGNRFQDFQSHINTIIRQNIELANRLNEYYDSDSSLSYDILNALRGKF